IGMAGNVAGEVRRVAAMRDAIGSSVALRLDANGAWESELAIATLRALAGFDIEFVEQPVPAHDLAGLAAVRRASPIAIAADEAVSGFSSAQRIIEQAAVDVLILKPMV